MEKPPRLYIEGRGGSDYIRRYVENPSVSEQSGWTGGGNGEVSS